MFNIKDEAGHGQIWRPTPGNQVRAHWRIQKILKELPTNANVLELGCGSGDLTRFLLKAGHQVTAIDLSKKMLNITKFKCQNLPHLVLLNEDLMSFLRHNKTTYDAIVGIGILHHLAQSLPSALSLISQNIKSDGCALFWEPNRLNPIVKFIFGTKLGRQIFKLEETEDAFSRHYFKILASFHFKKVVAVPKDWAYPFLPMTMIPIFRFLEHQTPGFLNEYIAQSIWIELHKSDFLEANIESPK